MPTGVRGVVIVGAARTAMGSFGGALSSVPAPTLGAAAIKGALERAKVHASAVQACIMGNVLSAGVGQAPARQAALEAGLPASCVCTAVNKVCSSGLKAIIMAVQEIQLGVSDIVIAGGMENMSLVPYYVNQGRFGMRMGDRTLVDGMIKDGLWDPRGDAHMGMFGERCAQLFSFSREDQDRYAVESYKRSATAQKSGVFAKEIVAVSVPNKHGAIQVVEDEEIGRTSVEKLRTQRPAFAKDGSGTVTAGNASPISDGAAAVLLMSEAKAHSLGIKILAKILGFGDAEREPEDFTTAPAYSIPKALEHACIALNDVDLFEINEAFSVVALANTKLLQLDKDNVNIHGGAVSLGHPLGCSGARIVVALLNALGTRDSRIGVAGICNGGGGSSAIVIKRE